MQTEKRPNTTTRARLRPLTPLPGSPHQPLPVPPPTVTRQRRRWWRLLWLLPVALLAAGLVAGGLWGNDRLREAEAAYRAVAADVDALQALRPQELTTLTEADLLEAEAGLTRLTGSLERLDRATQLPLSESRILRLPWIGPRYAARTTLLQSARELTAAAQSAVSIGREALAAFAATGASAATPPAGPTWLDVLGQRQGDLQAALAQARDAWALRATVDDTLLPERVQTKLAGLDRLATELLARDDLDPLLGDGIDTLRLALGGERPVRYLLLFQNSAEARLSGGFPGTIALVTIDRGQLRDYDFFDAYDLQTDYAARRRSPVPAPWPVATYFRHAELPIVDATWPADFPTGARQLLTMYAETGWPPVDGVVAITPAVVAALLEVTGPIDVLIDDELREITAANVHEEIERDRALARAGIAEGEDHKEVLALVGAELVDRLKEADRGEMKEIARKLKAAADARDLQAYSTVPRLAEILASRGWDGRLQPDPALPTLAVTFSSLVTTKSSHWIAPHLDLELGPAIAGWRRATLRIDLAHGGNHDGDPFYFGFQRWWVEVHLPDGSLRLASDTPLMPDPDAPVGGSYDVELHPQTTTSLTIEFAMPDRDALLLRRQPGITPMTVNAHDHGCQVEPFTLTTDTVLELPLGCGT